MEETDIHEFWCELRCKEATNTETSRMESNLKLQLQAVLGRFQSKSIWLKANCCRRANNKTLLANETQAQKKLKLPDDISIKESLNMSMKSSKGANH